MYLEAESIPVFAKLVRHVSEDALEEYVQQLEQEVEKYVSKDVNYGKAAKRMYNIFRYTGRYQEAAYLRAEKQGFNCDPHQCWLSAEAEVDARLTNSR